MNIGKKLWSYGLCCRKLLEITWLLHFFNLSDRLLEGSRLCVETTVLTLRHLCRVEFPPTPFEQLAPCLGPLSLLTTSDDEEVRGYACYALTDVALVHGSSVFTALSETLVQDLEQITEYVTAIYKLK